MPDRIVRDPECEQKTGLSRRQRHRMEKAGLFPKRRRVSAHVIGWLESELDEWIQSREVGMGERPKVDSQEVSLT